MKSRLLSLAVACIVSLGVSPGAIVLSQYVETDSGTVPKGIELWNSGGTTIDFSTQTLTIAQGTNGAAPVTLVTVGTGTLAAGAVMVVGTADIGTYLTTTFGGSAPLFISQTFNFNGDDALTISLGGVLQDIFGNPGSDPGTSWTGSGVSTANQNIALLPGITSGASVGYTDPSTRFEVVSSTPSASGGLAGFGMAPIPEPAALVLGSLGLLGLLRRRR
jgi:hypothetical protein